MINQQPKPLTAEELADGKAEIIHIEPDSLIRRTFATIEYLQNENERLKAADFWTNWVYPEGATPDLIQNELTDYRMVMDTATKVYDHVTGGRISKPNTHANVIIGEADARISDAINEAISEFEESLNIKLKSQLAAAVDTLSKECKPCGCCLAEFNCQVNSVIANLTQAAEAHDEAMREQGRREAESNFWHEIKNANQDGTHYLTCHAPTTRTYSPSRYWLGQWQYWNERTGGWERCDKQPTHFSAIYPLPKPPEVK